MSLPVKFLEGIKAQQLFSYKDHLLLAVSGGLDSVVLCALCKQAGFVFSIAHCNFQLRGAESERDEQFVRALAAQYGVEVFVKRFDTANYAAAHKLSTQEAARDLRYHWFDELISQDTRNQHTWLLTAHHADDNAETIAMNFFRGTGLPGLTGIPFTNRYIRRPLLRFSKDELSAYALENNLHHVEDSSNQSSNYSRNFFRNEILPAISTVYPQVKDNLQDNIRRFTAIEKLYRLATGELLKKICRQKGAEVHVPVHKLMSYKNDALIYELISPFHFQEKQVVELIKLAASDSGKFIVSPDGRYRIIKHRKWFIISPAVAAASQHITIENEDSRILFDLGTLRIEKTDNCTAPVTNTIAALDAREIRFPLLLRQWKTGDYFYPLGMRKKKKVARFLIDVKASKTEKEKVWVLESGQRICWVIGYRIDDRFKLTDSTGEVIRISLEIK